KKYNFNLPKNRVISLEVESTEFRPFLQLVDGAAKVIRQSSFSTSPARIVFHNTDPGQFALRVAGQKKGTGKYLLKVHARPVDPELAKKVALDKNGELQIESELTGADPQDAFGSAAKRFEVRMAKGKSYTMDLEATGFAPELRLEGRDTASSRLSQTTVRLV